MTYFNRTIICLFLAFIALNSSAGVYKWTDANGKIHFSDRPNKNAEKMTIKASKPSGLGTTNNQLKRQKELLLQYQNDRETKNKQRKKNKKSQQKREAYCKRLNNRIINYEEFDFLFTRDEQGKKKRLSSQQKKTETELLKKELKERCSK